MAQASTVSRDEAAAGVGVARHIAKFHLDKLLDDGLLSVEYARSPGRRGPGAGRPAKRYSRSSRELAVSLPQREYELAGRLFAQAFSVAQNDDDVGIGNALAQVSRSAGRALGNRARQLAGAHASSSALLLAATNVLGDSGYEPRCAGADITLVNCPFHTLAKDFTDLVCGMNLELMNGVVETLEHPDLEAHLEPAPGRCCVRLTAHSAIHHPVVDKEE